MTSLVCLYPLSKFLWESAQGGVIQLRVAFQAIDALCQTSQRLGVFWQNLKPNGWKPSAQNNHGQWDRFILQPICC